MAEKTATAIPEIKGKSKNGKEVTYCIKEIQNGYVVTKSFEWEDKEGDHHYESEEYFVKNNPVQKEADNMYEIMESVIGTDRIEM